MILENVAARIAAWKPALFHRVIVFAGSFDPFAMHHRTIVEQLVKLKRFLLLMDSDVPVEVVVWPVGAYATKQQVTLAKDRRAMLRLGLEGLDVIIRTDDLRRDGFGYTSIDQMQFQLSGQAAPELRDEYLVQQHTPVVLREVWHVVGGDNVAAIKEWNEAYRLWHHARFIVIARPGYDLADLPPKSMVLDVEMPVNTSCTNIRKLIAAREPWEHLVQKTVADHIRTRRLYQPAVTTKEGSTS